MTGGAGPYRLQLAANVEESIRALLEIAEGRRCLGRLADALLWANYRLQHDPERWGDPLYSLRNAEIVVYRAIAEVAMVFYGIDAVHHHVYLNGIRPNPLTPLADEGYTFPPA